MCQLYANVCQDRRVLYPRRRVRFRSNLRLGKLRNIGPRIICANGLELPRKPQEGSEILPEWTSHGL